MGIHQYLSQIRFLPAELAGELALGALTAKEEESLCPSRLTPSQTWHGGSPWALDKGRTQARPAARALGNWLPQFCIRSSEKCRDSTLTGPWRATGHRTCSCALRLSCPSPSSIYPLDVYPWETHKHLKFNKGLPLFAGNGSSGDPLLGSESPLFCSHSSPDPAQGVMGRSWLVPATRAQLHIHMGRFQSASVGVYTHRNQQTLQMSFLP